MSLFCRGGWDLRGEGGLLVLNGLCSIHFQQSHFTGNINYQDLGECHFLISSPACTKPDSDNASKAECACRIPSHICECPQWGRAQQWQSSGNPHPPYRQYFMNRNRSLGSTVTRSAGHPQNSFPSMHCTEAQEGWNVSHMEHVQGLSVASKMHQPDVIVQPLVLRTDWEHFQTEA